ncbi:hypothetical protein AAFF_G00303640 [Aldrovandia affinis]|uniref:Uncharacterized protein n=1 Tax=Aldrovandia affinis TaxID=143900 RepID=A0AAD7W1D5_9TELE|nr:hypothetical protein AAFF_G00303640 [Aldrovandia affinis]
MVLQGTLEVQKRHRRGRHLPPTATSVLQDTPDRAPGSPPPPAAAAPSTQPSASAVSPSPSAAPGTGLTMLAFGKHTHPLSRSPQARAGGGGGLTHPYRLALTSVMSFILILIVVMVILLTAVNLRGRCSSPKEGHVKREKESITLVSMKTISADRDTDSAQVSSAHSNTLESEDQELRRDLLITKQDNDPKHTLKLCKNYLVKEEREGQLKLMTWPAQCPDLNPIEIVCDKLDRRKTSEIDWVWYADACNDMPRAYFRFLLDMEENTGCQQR